MAKTLEYYSFNAAGITRNYERIEYASLIERLLELAGSSGRVLEVGTGSGRDAARLLRAGFDVTTLDGSRPMLDEAVRLHPELAGRTVELVLPAPFPMSDDTFDIVMSWATLMHLERSELRPVFSEVARVTRPGGVFSYSVNTERSGLDACGTDSRGRHFTCLPLHDWERLHEQTGFSTLEAAETEDLVGRPGIRWATFYTRLT